MELIEITNLNKVEITTQENNGHALAIILSDVQSALGMHLLLKDEKITLDYKHTFGRSYFTLLIQLQNTGKYFERLVDIDNKNVDWMDWIFNKKVTHLFVCHLTGNGTIPVPCLQAIRLAV